MGAGTRLTTSPGFETISGTSAEVHRAYTLGIFTVVAHGLKDHAPVYSKLADLVTAKRKDLRKPF